MARNTNPNKENREKLALKRAGHSLIDRIKWKGYSKTQVYFLLSNELGREERHAHFSAMNTIRELQPAVEALDRLLRKLPETTHARSTSFQKKLQKQKCPIVIKLPVPKPTTVYVPPKYKTIKEKKKVDVLPRKKVLEALEQMKQDRMVGKIAWAISKPQADRIQMKGGIITYIKKLLRL